MRHKNYQDNEKGIAVDGWMAALDDGMGAGGIVNMIVISPLKILQQNVQKMAQLFIFHTIILKIKGLAYE